MASIEEKVEEYYKSLLDEIGVRHYAKTEEINASITKALKQAKSKSGGSGNNYPDIQLLLIDNHRRTIPVMIEAKGTKNKLEKLDRNEEIEGITIYSDDQTKKDGTISHKKGEENYSTIISYAVNGAVHYANAILEFSDYEEVIAIGVNASEVDSSGNVKNPECKAYYISKKNKSIPKLIEQIMPADWTVLKKENLTEFYKKLDDLSLSAEDIERRTKKLTTALERAVMDIHQNIYDNKEIKHALSTNEKLYLFSGLIMANLSVPGLADLTSSDFKGNDDTENNDGIIVLTRVKDFLNKKKSAKEKTEMILNLFDQVFKKPKLWKASQGESLIKTLFINIRETVMPYLNSEWHLDFTGIILNKLSDWVQIENDKANDVVLTPRYVTDLMAKMARTDKDSFVWDNAMGSGGFLCSAMQLMINDAESKIVDVEERKEKIQNIKQNQLLGIEILNNVYVLAILNMILMGDGSSNIIHADSHQYKLNTETFPANVYLLNPPYSAAGKGFVFVEEALSRMTTGYACVLIQDSAGSGQGLPYTKRILEKNTLEASIKMPEKLFGGKASVNVYIYVFKVNRPHEADDIVTFIDFSEDGYSRLNRKKSTQEVNLRNTDHANERYDEVLAHVLGKKAKTKYYTIENGKIIKDCITLNGDDWNFTQHQKNDPNTTEDDFKKVVADYMSWKVSNLMRGA